MSFAAGRIGHSVVQDASHQAGYKERTRPEGFAKRRGDVDAIASWDWLLFCIHRANSSPPARFSKTTFKQPLVLSLIFYRLSSIVGTVGAKIRCIRGISDISSRHIASVQARTANISIGSLYKPSGRCTALSFLKASDR